MIALLIIKLKQISHRSRLLAGISVGVVFFLILINLLNGLNSNDKLVRFVRPNTTFYLSLNLSSAEKSLAGLKIIDRLLAGYQLTDLNRHWLKSNLGQICLADNNNQSCFLLFDARKTQEIQNYLAKKNIPYRRFGKTFAIADSREKLKSLRTNLLISPLKPHDKINRPRDITVYLRPQTGNSPKMLKIISLTTADRGGLSWHGKLSGPAISLIGDQSSFPLLSWPIISTEQLPKNRKDADLTLVLSEPIKFWQQWHKIISSSLPKDYQLQEKITAQLKKSYGFDPTDRLWSQLASQPLTIIAKSRSASGEDLLSGYDWSLFLSAGRVLSATDMEKIETMMKKLVSRRQPQVQTIYLSDGTPVAELLSGGEPQESSTDDGQRFFSNSDQSFILFYSTENDKLEMGNSLSWQPSRILDDKNYLKINLQAFKTYTNPVLADFNWLESRGNKVIIY
ncbi:MAG: hypothetical protein WC668_04475 [Patescibacteria group bacterium]|jgi:hypothetical protein